MPPLQTGVVPEHTVEQVPQFVPSVSRSTHVPLQLTVPGPQHRPAEQLWPVLHALPHAPQLLLSVSGSLHEPPQLLEPVAQHSGFVFAAVAVHV